MSPKMKAAVIGFSISLAIVFVAVSIASATQFPLRMIYWVIFATFLIACGFLEMRRQSREISRLKAEVERLGEQLRNMKT